VSWLWGVGGVELVEELCDFWLVLVGLVLGFLVGVFVGIFGWWFFLNSWFWIDLFVWWVWNVIGCVVIFIMVLFGMVVWNVVRRFGGSVILCVDLEVCWVEVVVLIVVSGVIYFGVFGVFFLLLVVFLFLVLMVWVGLWFSVFGVVLYSLVVCMIVVILMVVGKGVFVVVGLWSDEVLVF